MLEVMTDWVQRLEVRCFALETMVDSVQGHEEVKGAGVRSTEKE